MRRCPSCRAEVRPSAVLCRGCGAPLAGPPDAAAARPWRTALAVLLSVAGGLASLAAILWFGRPLLARLVPDPVRAAVAHLPAVITLTSYDEDDDETGQGSGFLADTGGVALTNFHVVAGARRVAARLDDGRVFDVVAYEAFDVDRDVCAVRLARVWDDGVPVPPGGVTPLVLRPRPRLRSGERIAALGSPRGFENTLSDGLVSALRSEDGRDYVQFTAPISPGSSGGPLFDDRGRVVGMVVSTRDDAQNLNFAIPAADLAHHAKVRFGWSPAEFLARVHAASVTTTARADSLFALREADGAYRLYSRANDLEPAAPAPILGMAFSRRALGDTLRYRLWLDTYRRLVPDLDRRRAAVRALVRAVGDSMPPERDLR